MSSELPADVRASLAALLDSGADAARAREFDAVEGAVDSVETLAHHEVADEELSELLRHGCLRVTATVRSEPLVAAEYLEAMKRMVEAD